MKLFVKEKKFYKTMVMVAVPISLQSLVSFCVNLIDTVMLGKYGEVALSASSLGGSYYMILNVICMGVGCGSAVITAQYWGIHETDPIRKMTNICLKLVLGAGLLFTALTLAIPGQIMSIYTNEADVIEEGIKYLRFLAISFAFSSLTTGMTQILRSVSIVRVTLIAGIAACVTNIFGNWILIFGNLGAPELKVAGAAMATSIARIVEFLVVAVYLLRDRVIGFRLKHMLGFDVPMLRRYLKTGLPVMVSDLVMVIGSSLITVIIGHMGSVFVAANSITNVVNNFMVSVFFGISNSSTILTGNSVGAGEYDKAYNEGKTFLTITLLIGIVGGILLYSVRNMVIGIYDVSGEAKNYASQMITVMSIVLPAQLLEHCLTKGVLRGGGDTRFLIVADTIFAYLVAAPLGYLGAFVLGFPIWAVYLCLRSDIICKTIVCLWRFVTKKWIRNVTLPQ